LGGGPSDDGDSDGQVNDGVNQGGVQA
jgi:hypothetical protein